MTNLPLLPAFTMSSVAAAVSAAQPLDCRRDACLHMIGRGKSYPVTAAQLLPVFTGFLAPIHFFKLAKNWSQNYPLAIRGSRFIYLATHS